MSGCDSRDIVDTEECQRVIVACCGHMDVWCDC